MHYFGTDGIRGEFGKAVVSPIFFEKLGRALGMWAKQRGCEHFVAGCDTRASGPVLIQALVDGVGQMGCRVDVLGVLPTPALARESIRRGCLGLMVTASHNPHTDNGVKVFNAGGEKITPEEEAAIESVLERIPEREYAQTAGTLSLPHVAMHESAYVKSLCQAAPDLKNLPLVWDTANGATAYTVPVVLGRLGGRLLAHLGDKPNGVNINDGVGSEHPQVLAAAVLENRACVGVAHDGDGDRVVMVDERGQVVNGDCLLGLLALHLHAKGSLRGPLVVTVQSNLGVDCSLRSAGIEVVRCDVGDRNVWYTMKKHGASLGGEASGHIIFGDSAPSGDGLLAALQVLAVMQETRLPLSSLAARVSLFPQKTRNLVVKSKPPMASLKRLPATISELEASFADRGRLLVRYSGTENKIRLLVEGPAEKIDGALNKLEEAVRAEIG